MWDSKNPGKEGPTGSAKPVGWTGLRKRRQERRDVIYTSGDNMGKVPNIAGRARSMSDNGSSLLAASLICLHTTPYTLLLSSSLFDPCQVLFISPVT